MTKLPVFICEPLNSKVPTWRFWCPYCAKWHVHSAQRGHRAAHCSDDSPLKEGGYIIELDPRFSLTSGKREEM